MVSRTLTRDRVPPSMYSIFLTRDQEGERSTWRATPPRTLTTAVMSSNSVVTPRDVTADNEPLYKFLLDFMFWSQHVHPRHSTREWPVGKIASHVSIANALKPSKDSRSHAVVQKLPTTPPSAAKRIDEMMALTESDAWSMYMPFVDVVTDVKLLVEPMWSTILNNTTRTAGVPAPSPAVSDALHEDEQLCYGRKGIPLCSLGDQCAARLYAGNQGPLHVYLLPTVARAHALGRTTYVEHDEFATCLLCIRRDVHGACLAWEAMVPNPARQIQRSSIIPPPFTNLVDVPAGYRSDAFISAGDALFDNANVVGVSGALCVKYSATRKHFYFDQTRIKCLPPSFLGARTATLSL